MKNWTVKTKQLKKKDKGVINYSRYLLDAQRPSHFDNKITPIKDPLRATKNILSEHHNRKMARIEQGIRGGGIQNWAQSYVFSLPQDVPQPTPKQWEEIAKKAIMAISEVTGVDAKSLWRTTGVVLHEAKPGSGKNSHIHLIHSNVVDGEYNKGLTQYKSVYATKRAFNDTMLKLLMTNVKDYKPKEPGKNKPAWKVRQEQEQATIDYIDEQNELVIKKAEKLKEIDEKLNKKYRTQTKMLFEYYAQHNAARVESTLNRLEKTEEELEELGLEVDKEQQKKRRTRFSI